MSSQINRRQFLRQSVTATAGALLLSRAGAWAQGSPNNKLNLGIIGVANRGSRNITGVKGENIVAICDIDQNFLGAAHRQFPAAKTYTDYRRLLEQRDIDAVVISTADHTHAVATVDALRSGRHVYCEKPLTHTVSEARRVAQVARETKLATQMGNQIHASNNYRRVVEVIKSGVIGPVREVHCWADHVWETKNRPQGEPVPAHVDYDLWLGPVTPLPYSAEYHPFNWRRWWHFGGGTLGDFCCHLMDLPYWALDLQAPQTVEAEGPEASPDCVPPWMVVRYQYGSRAKAPPVKLVWYSGGRRPERPLPKWGNGVLFIGDKGMLLADYGKYVLLPETDFSGYQPPAPSIPDSIGHHAEWIEACKTGSPTSCHFGYGAQLTEAGLLGNVAYRVGRKIEWDAARMRVKNAPEAAQLINHHYRAGWTL